MSHKVFVYGTLKRNEPNHYWITDKNNGVATFLGEGTTTSKYPLVIATVYNIPFLLHQAGTGYFVKGEVYEVDDNMLSRLDVLEEHPNYYVREIDDIKVLNVSTKQEETMQCWVYFLKKFKPDLLHLPMMECYNSTGDHGKPYTPRSKRDPNYDMYRIKDVKSEIPSSVRDGKLENKPCANTSGQRGTVDHNRSQSGGGPCPAVGPECAGEEESYHILMNRR